MMITLYAHPASQPARSVIWACVIKSLPIQLQTSAQHLGNVNPRRQMPAIDDQGFTLTEMPAILTYLADKHGWDDLYPQDLHTRARIHAYLHAHHSLTRLATMKLMAPHIHVAFTTSQLTNPHSYLFNQCVHASMASEQGLAEGQQVVEQMLDYLEEVYLQKQDFIAGTSQASLADIACYDEIGQLEYAQLIDVSQRPALQNWMARMRQLPFYDVVHCYNYTLGDINTTPNTLPRFGKAIDASMQALRTLDTITFV